MNLNDFFKEYPCVAVAFSGGVDSAYLLSEAKRYAKKVFAYYVKSAFQPQFELDDALRLARELDIKIKVIDIDVLSDEKIISNPHNRCYFCKRRILGAIINEAEKDGFSVVLDGTNASDKAEDRPGTKALSELSVLSPLKLCGLSKEKIRELSEKSKLFTWDKPAYACLATRISEGELITEEKLAAIEKSEEFLSSLGFTDFRVRVINSCARLQVCREQVGLVLEKKEDILAELKKFYDGVLLDLEVRK